MKRIADMTLAEKSEYMRVILKDKFGYVGEYAETIIDNFQEQEDIFEECIRAITGTLSVREMMKIDGYNADDIMREFDFPMLNAYKYLVMLREDPKYAALELSDRKQMLELKK